MLDRPGGLAMRSADVLRGHHPATVFVAVCLAGYAALAAFAIGLGFLLTEVVLPIHGVSRADERFVNWLVAHRSPTLTDASLIGSIVAGGVVIPTLVGVAAAALACLRRWRIAGFLVAAIGLEAATYRLSTVFVHRPRPHVVRLEHLPANASYPSGHTAAAIAVYCGLALLLTSRFQNVRFRVPCWTVAAVLPVYVAVARMYRGMHHPLDSLAGVVIGIGSLVVAVVAARAAGCAARRRTGSNDDRADPRSRGAPA